MAISSFNFLRRRLHEAGQVLPVLDLRGVRRNGVRLQQVITKPVGDTFEIGGCDWKEAREQSFTRRRNVERGVDMLGVDLKII